MVHLVHHGVVEAHLAGEVGGRVPVDGKARLLTVAVVADGVVGVGAAAAQVLGVGVAGRVGANGVLIGVASLGKNLLSSAKTRTIKLVLVPESRSP